MTHWRLLACTRSASRCRCWGDGCPPPGARACSLSQGDLLPSRQTQGGKGALQAAVTPRLPWCPDHGPGPELLCASRQQGPCVCLALASPLPSRRPRGAGPKGLRTWPGWPCMLPSDVSDMQGALWGSRMGRLMLQRRPQTPGLREADSHSSYRPRGLQGFCPTQWPPPAGGAPPRAAPARDSA